MCVQSNTKDKIQTMGLKTALPERILNVLLKQFKFIESIRIKLQILCWKPLKLKDNSHNFNFRGYA